MSPVSEPPPSDWDRLQEAFDRARGLSGDERERFLAALDWPDALRARLRALLAADASTRAHDLETPAWEGLDLDDLDDGAAAWQGRVLDDRWRLLEPIARGGMGMVFHAKRVGAGYEQEVAVKLLQEGFQHGSLAARFRKERRLLATLKHPNVAALLDGGETEDGIPYLVMEYVRGRDLVAYADAEGLDLRRRVELVLPLCDALQAAHRRLVVHRDLKAANVLVDDTGRPVLLDFGIARLLEGEDEETEGLTRASFPVLTPAYASPEQLRGEEVGIASDLYSFGVVLFRLFTGEMPDDAEGVTMFELARERGERPPPSLRERDPAVPADLDAIVRKCLRPEPERRYGSAAELAADLRRFLRGLPVSARPDTFTYRASRFLRRNLAASLLGAAALAALAAGVVGVVWQRNEARREAELASRVSGFLLDLFESGDPWQSGRASPELQAYLDRGRRLLLEGLEDEPELRSRLARSLAIVESNLGAHEEALALYDLARAADPGLASRDPAAWADLLFESGRTRYRSGDLDGAVEDLEAARDVLEERGESPELAGVLNTLGLVRFVSGDEEAGRTLLERALELRERLLGPDDPEVAVTLQNLGAMVRATEGAEAALPWFERAVAIMEAAHSDGEGHPDLATTLNNLGMVLLEAGRLDEAEAVLGRALAMREALLPPDHPHVATTRNNLGLLLVEAGRPDEAVARFREALAAVEGSAPPDHPLVRRLRENLAEAESAARDQG